MGTASLGGSKMSGESGVLESGKIVILLQGRFAGHKAVIVRAYPSGTKKRPFPHAMVAGVDRYPLKVTKAMNKRTVSKRSRVKTFIKVVNLAHVMPTRYKFEGIELRHVVNEQMLKPNRRYKARKIVQTKFEKRYRAGKTPFFFTKL